MASRTAYAMLNLAGRMVEVKLASGSVVTGVFAAQSAQGKRAETFRLLMPIVLSVGSDGIAIPANVQYYEIAWNQVESVFCKNGATDASKPGFRTDTAISGRGTGKGPRRLENVANEWLEAPSNSNGSLAAGAEDSSKPWDQFQANAEKFGVKSTYDETLYTMKLEKDNLTPEQLRKAEQIAKEIEGNVSSNPHLMEERGHEVEGWDEEARYGAVVGSGAYTKGKQGSAAPAGSATKAWGTGTSAASRLAASTTSQNGTASKAPQSTDPVPAAANAPQGKAAWGSKDKDNAAGRSFASVLRGQEQRKLDAAAKDGEPKQSATSGKAGGNDKVGANNDGRKKLTEDLRNFSKGLSKNMKAKEGESASKATEKASSDQPKKTSTLNANARPFTLKATAKPFVPGGGAPAPVVPAPVMPPMPQMQGYFNPMQGGVPQMMMPGAPMFRMPGGVPMAPLGMQPGFSHGMPSMGQPHMMAMQNQQMLQQGMQQPQAPPRPQMPPQ